MKQTLLIATLFLFPFSSYADKITSPVYTTKDKKPVGQITFEDSVHGLLIKPSLENLPAGVHGLHVHENPSCEKNGLAAGGHYDPAKSDSHEGPYGKGHLGDLPVLYVDLNNQATIPTLAPRLGVKDIKGRSIMIHAGGDNYTNQPKLGGGGKRAACGIID